MAVDEPAPAVAEWQHIDCSSKTAYGCGEHGQGVLDGLNLYVRRRRINHPDLDLTSSMSVHLSAAAIRSAEAGLAVTRGGVDPFAAVKLATGDLLILILIFQVTLYNQSVYCVVYDATDASLYTVPYVPDDFLTSYTSAPVPCFTGAGAGRDHELVLMARTYQLQLVDGDRLCVSTPVAKAANPGSDGGIWQVMIRRFPDLPYCFTVDTVFSSQGKVFWVDLWQGLVCCDLRARRADQNVVELQFIELPQGYLAHNTTESGRERRTMACIDGTIKFLSIDDNPRSRSRSSRHGNGNPMVWMWALDLDRQSWKEEEEEGFPFPLKELLEQVHFMDAAELRGVQPQYPVLLPDGAFCLLLPNMLRRVRAQVAGDYLSCFDMRDKRLQWFGRVPVDYGISGSAVIPCNFFTKCCVHRSKRQLPTLKKKLRRSSSSQQERRKTSLTVWLPRSYRIWASAQNNSLLSGPRPVFSRARGRRVRPRRSAFPIARGWGEASAIGSCLCCVARKNYLV